MQVDSITQVDPDAMFFNPVSMEDNILHDRPPLLLEGALRCADDDSDSDSDSDSDFLPISVMAVHNRSLGSIDDPVQGVRVRLKRFLQAESIAEKVLDLQAADPDVQLIVTGDFNAFEFTDGFVDAVGILTGAFDPSDNLVCDENPTLCADLETSDLADEVLGLPEEERYSFIFGGNAQVLDHALTSAALEPFLRGTEFGRGNADAASDLINDVTTPLRASDHDGLAVYVSCEEADDDDDD